MKIALRYLLVPYLHFIAVATVVLFPLAVPAKLIVSESFDFPATNTLSGNRGFESTGWENVWGQDEHSSGSASVAANSLPLPGSLTSIFLAPHGNHGFAAGMQSSFRYSSGSMQRYTNVWGMFLTRASATSNSTANFGLSFRFGFTYEFNLNFDAGFDGSATAWNLDLPNQGRFERTASASAELIIFHLQLDASGTGDRLKLWFDTNPQTEIPTFQHEGEFGEALHSVFVSFGSSNTLAGSSSIAVDEIRIGTEFADLTNSVYQPQPQPPFLRYMVVELPTLRQNNQGSSTPTAINNQGIIVGHSERDGAPHHAFRIRPGSQIEDLGSLNSPSFASAALAISADGKITGYSATQPGGFASAFRIVDGSGMQDLAELPGGGDSFGYSINTNGQIVGWSNRAQGCGGPECPGNPGFAVRWDVNTPVALLDFPGTFSIASGINELGHICGTVGVPGGATTAFAIVADDEFIFLPDLEGSNNTAVAISNSGAIVGSIQTPQNQKLGALWIRRGFELFSPLEGMSQSTLTAFALGNISDHTGFSRAVEYSGGCCPYDLNMLIAPDSGWELDSAAGGNTLGYIIGSGRLNGAPKGFLLVPIANIPRLRAMNPTTLRLQGTTGDTWVLETKDTLEFSTQWTALETITFPTAEITRQIETSTHNRFFRMRK